LLLGVFGAVPGAAAGEVTIANGPPVQAHVRVTSYRDIPFKTVVRQEFDFSCGSAAIATLLTYHFERPTTEKDAFVAMYDMGDQEKIKREGFSLYEIKLYLESIGYRADGFKVDLDRLQRVAIPVIVLIEWKNYKHFVVVKGVRDGYVLVGDPAIGLKIMKRDEFMSYWKDGIAFAIHNADFVGRKHFNDEAEWRGRPKAPLATAVNRTGLSTLNLLLPGAAELF
jgi:predicted double-glycine peptidase